MTSVVDTSFFAYAFYVLADYFWREKCSLVDVEIRLMVLLKWDAIPSISLNIFYLYQQFYINANNTRCLLLSVPKNLFAMYEFV